VVNSAVWADEIIYKVKTRLNGPSDISDYGNGLYSVIIKTDILKTGGNYDLITPHWQPNTYYKV
jgi:hypothetical protein